MGNYYQPEIETMPVEKLQALQSERLVKQVKYVYDHVEFYRNKMKEAGVEPEDIKGIEDLHKLPFVTKDDLRCMPCSLRLWTLYRRSRSAWRLSSSGLYDTSNVFR